MSSSLFRENALLSQASVQFPVQPVPCSDQRGKTSTGSCTDAQRGLHRRASKQQYFPTSATCAIPKRHLKSQRTMAFPRVRTCQRVSPTCKTALERTGRSKEKRHALVLDLCIKCSLPVTSSSNYYHTLACEREYSRDTHLHKSDTNHRNQWIPPGYLRGSTVLCKY